MAIAGGVSYAGNENSSLTIDTASLPNTTIGEEYKADLTASGGKRPYSWAVEGLPNGLNFDQSSGKSGESRHKEAALAFLSL